MIRSQRKLLVGVVVVTAAFIPLDVVFGAEQTLGLTLSRLLLVGGYGTVAWLLPRFGPRARSTALTVLGALSPFAVALMCWGTGGTKSPAFTFMWGTPMLVALLLLEEPLAVVAATLLGVAGGAALLVSEGLGGAPLAYFAMVTLCTGALATASTTLLRRSHRADLRLQREREALLESLIGAMPGAVLVADAEGRRAWWNVAGGGMLALERDGRTKASIERALRGEASHLELEIGDRVFDLRCSPLSGAAGEATHAVALLVDVTQRKRDEAALQAAREKLVRAERIAALGTLSAGVAHEINNPLQFIASNLTFMADDLAGRDDAVSKKLLELLRDTHEGVFRVRDIVRDLGTFASSEQEAAGLPVDLVRCLDGALARVAPELQRCCRVERRLEPVPPVPGTEHRLEQVFVNLLTNAAHAMPPGGAAPGVITVKSGVDEQGRVVAEVADTGSGIPPDVLPRIFEPFFTTKPPGAGTGLGLSTCHGIIRQLGGTLEVETEPGRGSTFRVRLPAARVTAGGTGPARASEGGGDGY